MIVYLVMYKGNEDTDAVINVVGAEWYAKELVDNLNRETLPFKVAYYDEWDVE